MVREQVVMPGSARMPCPGSRCCMQPLRRCRRCQRCPSRCSLGSCTPRPLAGASFISWNIKTEIPMFVAVVNGSDYDNACKLSADNTTRSERACAYMRPTAALSWPSPPFPHAQTRLATAAACDMMSIANKTVPGSLCVARECRGRVPFDPLLRDWLLTIAPATPCERSRHWSAASGPGLSEGPGCAAGGLPPAHHRCCCCVPSADTVYVDAPYIVPNPVTTPRQTIDIREFTIWP